MTRHTLAQFDEQVYFSYCASSERVTDYRTKVSGITKALLEGAPSHAQVQAEVREP